MMNFGRDHARHVARTPATQACGHSNVVSAGNRERNREALHRRSQARLPECPAGLDVHGLEIAIQITDKGDASASQEHPSEKRAPLLDRPLLLHAPNALSPPVA